MPACVLHLLFSVLLASRSACALCGRGSLPRRAAAQAHRRGLQHPIQLTAVGLESSDVTSPKSLVGCPSAPHQLGSLPAFREEPQDLAADQIVPDEWNPDSAVADGPGSFVEIFRSSTPYIKMHRATTMVSTPFPTLINSNPNPAPNPKPNPP